jgi:osmotically inducible protein OsmC
MAGTQRAATATWKGTLFDGSGTVHFDSSNAVGELPVTWASRAEAPDGRTSPEELIAAAHATCISMALSAGLAKAGHPADRLTTTATATFEKKDVGFRITRMHIRIRGAVPGMSASDFVGAANGAKDGCPVSNALQGNVEIELDAALES